jgi:hypothetical protein
MEDEIQGLKLTVSSLQTQLEEQVENNLLEKPL